MTDKSSDNKKQLDSAIASAKGGIRVSPAQQKVINSMNSEETVKKMVGVLRTMLMDIETKK